MKCPLSGSRGLLYLVEAAGNLRRWRPKWKKWPRGACRSFGVVSVLGQILFHSSFPSFCPFPSPFSLLLSSFSLPLFLPSSSLPLSPYQLPGDVKLTLSWAAMMLSRQGLEGTECWSHARESPPLTLLSLRSRYSWREADKITDEIKRFYKTIFSTSLPLSSFLSFLPPSLLSFLPFFVFIVYS